MGYVAAIAAAVLWVWAAAAMAQEVGEPVVLWDYATPGELPQSTVTDGRRPFLYAATKNGGLQVLRLKGDGGRVKKVAQLLPGEFGGHEVMNLVKHGDLLFLALGNFFGAGGAKAGLAIVDVQKPRKPRIKALWTTAEKLRGAAIVITDGRHAYLGAMSAGVIILDVSAGTRIKEVSRIRPDIHFPRRNPGAIQHPNARGMALEGDRLFVAFDAGGLRVIDVADKTRPREIGRHINRAMMRKQQAYNNVVLDGDRAYVALDYCGMEILDISKPAEIRQLACWNPWGCDKMSNMWFNSPGHTNQLILDKARRAVVLSAGDSEMQVVDVSDPRQPKLKARVGAPKNKRGVWGVSAGDGALYLTYIKAFIPFASRWSGIRAVKWP